MLNWALPLAQGAVVLAMLLAFWRLVRGPDAVDRVLALDTLYIDSIALLVLVGIELSDSSYFTVGILIAMMGFLSTVALARYLAHGKVFG
ncbi:K+/H+ antiporter subunit F [Chitinivorax sp. PXF-14]|uniref:K+/H+ antiporter subunit F n=1 Tax=Chitinivorax sp. PXF-14 TaxID=3230488 RepID=UPI003465AC9C